MLNKSVIEETINTALHTGGDFAEVFVENKVTNSINLVNGKIDSANTGIDYGVGIRVIKDTNEIYVYTNNDDKNNLLKLAKKAASMFGETDFKNKSLKYVDHKNLHPVKIIPADVNQVKKVDLIKKAYKSANEYDELITQVVVGLSDYTQNVQIANSEGIFIEDERTRVRMGIQAVATLKGEKQTGYLGPGGHMGFEFFDEIDVEKKAQEAARMAVTMIKAGHAPQGKMPVIIDNKFGGVIFHEACGHGLEATSVAKNNSVFANKLGEKIASEKVTAIDDGTLPNAWGSQNFDDEGHKTQRNVLIKDGILKGYMVDYLNGRRLDMQSTGSGRRQSYRYSPTSRMTNTFIDNGEHSLEGIIAETEYGLYAKHMGGGSVNPATGEFNFNVREGYIVEDGEIKKPVRGATLIGKGADILKKIDLIGNNLDIAEGMCGSISGSVPAGVGQPTIRVSELTVGGRGGTQ
ncbi:MAG TPA: TldD/PmbA family protein [Halanaerobiales bacterium]|nr:TldD/PmbA family protein [Halanaerobiales bacterium]